MLRFVRKHLRFLPVKPCLVGFVLQNHAGGDAWNNIILNGSRETQEVDIPCGATTPLCSVMIRLTNRAWGGCKAAR